MATIPYNGFEKGLITEGNPLQYPEGATKDELNFDLLVDGTRRKRLGLEIEAGGEEWFTSSTPPSATGSHVWDTQVDGYKFIVVQMDYDLFIWPADRNPITANAVNNFYNFSGDLTKSVINPPQVDFASGNGYLIVVGEAVKPLFFEYKGLDNQGDPIIESGQIDIRIRDFTGIDDGLAVDTRPGDLSTKHRYNLLNQGWEITNTYFG